MKCETCANEHDGTYATGRFCSVKCARSFSTKLQRTVINERVSQQLSGKKTGRGWTPEALQKCRQAWIKACERRWKFGEFALLKTHNSRKQRVLFEQDYRCAVCNCEQVHNNLPLTFQLDHINGDRSNNARTNLQALCPNCHTQTATWGAKNLTGEARQRWIEGSRRGGIKK